MNEFQHATREHFSLTAAAEKRLLIWIARRLPPFVNSDHLTALGFLSMIGAGLSYWYAAVDMAVGLSLVAVFLVLNWFGDSLDGTLARVRDRQRPRYGFYLDHVLDSVGSVFLLAGLGLSGIMSLPVAMALLIAYLLVSIETFLATYALGKFHMSAGLFGPTELRILLLTGNAFLFYRPEVNLFGARYKLFDVGGLCGAAGMVFILVRSTVRHAAALYREETRW
ncbi:MAG: CDP-alcohol phosphatidyltransferase family protein [Acidobacteriota bacterium]